MNTLQKVIIAIIGTQLVGVVSGLLTSQSIALWYAFLEKPPFNPPNWLFAPVWTILYALMGISFALIWSGSTKTKQRSRAKELFYAQLILNYCWSFFFFGFRSPLLGLVTILLLWWMIILTIRAFYPLSKAASYLLIPYLLWVSFATVLNAAIFVLN